MTPYITSEILIKIGHSDNGLSPDRHQAIIWTTVDLLSIGLLGTNFNEIWIKIGTFLFKKMRLKMLPLKWQAFCLGLNVLTKDKAFIDGYSS